jgi:hypothetical protein
MAGARVGETVGVEVEVAEGKGDGVGVAVEVGGRVRVGSGGGGAGVWVGTGCAEQALVKASSSRRIKRGKLMWGATIDNLF